MCLFLLFMIWVAECMLRIRHTVYPACGIYGFTPRKLEYDRRRASIITRALPSLDQMDRIIWPILTSQLSCVKEFTLCPNILVICSLWDSKSEEYWWSELQLVRTWNLHLWRVAGPISHSSITRPTVLRKNVLIFSVPRVAMSLEIRRISGYILRTSSRNAFATRGTKKISLVGFELRTSIFTELLAP